MKSKEVRAVLAAILAAALFVYSIVRLCMGHTILDWKIITISVWAVGGFILIGLGLVGEYVGRAYQELKGRPRYHIGETVGLE
jgi:hypothetical protein